MVSDIVHASVGRLLAAVMIAGAALAGGQTATTSPALPRVIVPTGSRPMEPARPMNPTPRIIYPWKTHVTCTVFWIGEPAGGRNTVSNIRSSWDAQWTSNFGGSDDPDPDKRIANFTTGEFRPKGFVPKLNPFYVALPYNDVQGSSSHKPEAARVIPWFARMRPDPGKTVCKGRWLQIYRGGRSCYCQWEDCGPWETDDWDYVFGNKPPKTTQNGAAGIDLSPAVCDYLGVKSGEKVHWRFIEASEVPSGPWKKFGQDAVAASDPKLDDQRRYMENLRKLRDEQFLKKPLSQLQN